MSRISEFYLVLFHTVFTFYVKSAPKFKRPPPALKG